jgi:hypothetical protein
VGDAELLGQAALGYGLGAGGLHRALRCDLQHIAMLEEALTALGPVESPLRVRLLARLAEELYFTPETSARAALCAEAIAMARRIGDPAVLLPALHARELGHVGPDVPIQERIDDAAELARLAEDLGDDEAAYLGHMLRELALMEAGRRAEALPELEAAERLADRIAVPGLLAWAATARSRQNWLAGRFAEAEADNARAMMHALEKGGDPDVANLVVGGQMLAMQILRVDLGQFVPALVEYRAVYPQFVILRCFTAYALSESGDVEAARLELNAADAEELEARRAEVDPAREGRIHVVRRGPRGAGVEVHLRDEVIVLAQEDDDGDHVKRVAIDLGWWIPGPPVAK